MPGMRSPVGTRWLIAPVAVLSMKAKTAMHFNTLRCTKTSKPQTVNFAMERFKSMLKLLCNYAFLTIAVSSAALLFLRFFADALPGVLDVGKLGVCLADAQTQRELVIETRVREV